jgi:ureidoacrylate peracid hydrolase
MTFTRDITGLLVIDPYNDALHHRYRPGDYESWKYIAPIQKAAWDRKTFEFGTWGGELREEFLPQPGDIVAQEHWCSSGFATTSTYSDDHMHAAMEVNLPNYAAVVAADEVVDAISASR